MSRNKVEWTDSALMRLDEIHRDSSSEAKSEMPADKFIFRIIDKTAALSSFPHIGQQEEQLLSAGIDARYLVVGNYKIIYRIKDKMVYVIDVFHTHQNPSKIIRRNRK